MKPHGPTDPAVLALLSSTPPDPPSPLETPDTVMAFVRSLRRAKTSPPHRPALSIDTVEDLTICNSIPIRIYRMGCEPRPVVVYFHGGGWVSGNLESHDRFCRRMAAKAEVVVMSVDYRLAPENPYPAPLDDAFAATEWMFQNAEEWGANPARLAVAGASAGANLAAAVALRFRGDGGPMPDLQVLLYAALDSEARSLSASAMGVGYNLTAATIEFFWRTYAPDPAVRASELVSPLQAQHFAGLPTALIEAAEFDPLRGDSHAYAERLHYAGVETRLTTHAQLLHGFVAHADRIPLADVAIEGIVNRIRRHLHRALQ